MQTFLPYPNYDATARCLDRARLGKQRVETLQILGAIRFGGGWSNHPAVKMWASYFESLVLYGVAICDEWIRRGYRDTCRAKIMAYTYATPLVIPTWLGDSQFHASHQSNLLRKDALYYSQFGWNVANNLPYVWPL